jgi:GH25 family lysozyme M1 (1,4-beta-N-acetylmuramidase)
MEEHEKIITRRERNQRIRKKKREERIQRLEKWNSEANILATIVVCLIALAALTGCIYLLLENQRLRQSGVRVIEQPREPEEFAEPEEGVYLTDEEYDALLAARRESDNAVKEMFAELKTRLAAGEDLSAILRAMLTDDIVVVAESKYYFFPIVEALAKHGYDPDRFLQDDDGLLSYLDEEGNVISQKGVDVSRYQNKIDWEKVAADGVEFAFIRVGYRGSTEGTLVTDQYFEDNIKGALEHGIAVGVYFFTQAVTELEAVEEAEFLLEHIEGYEIRYPVVIDIEAIETPEPRTQEMTKDEWTDVTIAFCERIKQAGYTPMIYGNLRSFFLMLDLDRLEEYEKWFAYWRTPIYFPYRHSIWQYTAAGRVDGIDGDVDLNIGLVRYDLP